MESYRTEEEQVEALKRWWDENGRSTIIGVVLALSLGFGWQAWQSSQQRAAENASNLYQQMLLALASAEEAGDGPAREIAQVLKDQHRGSSYAQFAALHLARLAVNDGDLATAEQELRWVLAMTSTGDEVQQIAQLRLARVVAANGDAEGALAMLEGAGPDFGASYAIARGDILVSMDREAEALAAYEEAKLALDPASPAPPTLDEKVRYLQARQAGGTD